MVTANISRRTPSRLWLILPMALLIGSLAVGSYWLSATAVTLVLNGQTLRTRTHQPTVADFLHEIGVSFTAADKLSPDLTASIQTGLTITLQQAHTVVIDLDHKPRQLLTTANQVTDILTAAQIEPQPHDSVQVLPDPASTPTDIVIRPAVLVQLIDNGQTRSIYTTAATVSGALTEAGVTLYVADLVMPGLETPIKADIGPITIERSQPVTITVDSRTLVTRTRGLTVGDVLAEANIALVGLDRAAPNSDQPFSAGMTINVVRVTENDEIEQTAIPFQSVEQVDPSAPVGSRRVIQPGVEGVQQMTVRVRRENGIEVSRSAPIRWQIRAAQAEIVAVGIGTAPPTVTF